MVTSNEPVKGPSGIAVWGQGALPRLFVGAFLLSLAFQSGSRPVNDGYAAIVVAEGLIDDGDWVYYPGYSPG